ncbi:MAG: septum formation inhibitor Maf [Helicobacter sp.]|nr:septum formation inhibitor Maf [Helicobacter sp.]
MLRLCSTSKVRSKLLSEQNIPFIQSDNGFDEEQISSKNPISFVYQATLGKHQKALETYGLEIPLLIVDTAIECQGCLQRKAKNIKEARIMLQKQSGNTIKILTCMILHSHKSYLLDLSQTILKLTSFLQEDLENYLQKGLWQNKAGSVMVEGFHQKYIQKQIGSTSNAMGLNLEVLKAFWRSCL